MDIKKELGELYREDMSFADIEAAFAEKNYIDPTTLPKSVDKNTFDKTASELAAAKKELNLIKQSQMTEEQQRQAAEQEIKQREIEKDTRICRLLMEKEFASAGYSEQEYTPLIESFGATNAEKAVEFAKSLAKLRTDSMKAIEQKLREESFANMDRPQAVLSAEATKAALQLSYQQAQEKQDFVAMASIAEQAATANIQI